MQAVILAAGKSSRLYPYNQVHKSLVKIMGEPIIVHTIRAIKKSGINDVVIVAAPNNLFEDILGNGKKFGVKITYVVQKEATGMGDALLCAKDIVTSDFFVLHAHHVEFAELKADIDRLRGTNNHVVLLAKEEDRLSAFGVLKVDGDRVLEISEKPEDVGASSGLVVKGVYFLNHDFINTLSSVKKEHYSFEKALDEHARSGKVKVALTSKEVVSLKYSWDLLGVKNYLFKKIKRHISKKANISPSAQIIGEVVVSDGAEIAENAVIKGPVYIGHNVYVGTNALVRNETDIEDNAKIGAFMEIRGSLIFENSSTHSGFIGNSIIGKNSKLGALFGSANVRFDRQNILATFDDKKIDTGLRSFGVVVGSNTGLGERVSTMPGVIIGNNTNIGPSTTVMKNVDSDVSYYTKFSENVVKNKPAHSA